MNVKAMTRSIFTIAVLSALLILSHSTPAVAQKPAKQKDTAGTPVLWRDPGVISARDLRYGPGSAELAPVPPFTFVSEDKSGSSPKFSVKDSKGVEWKVKLGEEAQAETVVVRLLWAMGYFSEEAYYFDRVQVTALPRLSRGREFIEGDFVRGARFEPRREGVKRGAEWDWEVNPFAGSRELDGLKVLMVLLNNYDVRVSNNRILHVTDEKSGRAEAQYFVTDLGATLGNVGGLGGKRTKNNLEDFASSQFIQGTHADGTVKFAYSTRPKNLGIFAAVFRPSYHARQVKKEKVMQSARIEHARWIGTQLSQLSDEQLRDAFDAAGYSKDTREAYIKVLRDRINQLTRL
ncbi:MAG TPA: hypothetical protein VFY67_20410 [Pyrinomonadaceae bacterium]|nr:hypothetical protein [Pyrinomonadaceae bacterium]